MPDTTLSGCKVAILITDGFEEVELTKPREALQAAGASASIVAPSGKTVRSWVFTDWGKYFDVDLALDAVSADEFDALVLPGGVINPDKLRTVPEAVAFVKAFLDAGKPVAAVCHGPWTLIEAGGASGRRMTSWPSIKNDLINAGADWVDEEVVEDRGLITSRKPDDLQAFCHALINACGAAMGTR